MSQPSNPENPSAAMPAFPSESFDALDQILDDMRTRDDEIPQWEFCEGFMAATLYSRLPTRPSAKPLRRSGNSGRQSSKRN